MMTPKSRSCAKCGVEKPLEEFHRQKDGKFGRRSLCKVCTAKYREGNREKIRERARQYREGNPEKVREAAARYREGNREKILEWHRRYGKENLEKIRERHRQYREANPEKRAANRAKRRAAKLNRTPSWADIEHIKQFYEARQAISEATGREYHVDHMIPLQGKTVSGLHVPGNLQIIPAERNMSKSNTF